MTTRDDYAASLRRRWENTPPPEGTTEPRECLDDAEATVLDGWCAHVGFRHVGPCPPAPATEDDAVAAWQARAEQIIDERTAERDRWRNTAESNAERLATIEAEVERSERDWKQASEDADRWYARAEAAEAEVERLTDLLHTATNDATARDARREVAEQQVADLRAGIEALPHLTVNTDGGRMTVVRVDDLNRALLAGPGEQPGEHEHGDWDQGGYCNRLVLDDDGYGVVCGYRHAPVVPDSAGLRERARAALTAAWDKWFTETSGGGSITPDLIARLADAVLAVVGQGVTAEQAWDEGWKACASAAGTASPHHNGPRNPYRVVVRSGEQGGEG